MDEEIRFDRRAGDLNVEALGLRVGALERRVEVVESAIRDNSRELAANTALTEEIHGKIGRASCRERV